MNRPILALILCLCGLQLDRAEAQLWTIQSSGSSRNLRGIGFAGPQRGVIVGDYGTLLRSSDGGAQWSPWTTGITSHLRAVALREDGSGYIVGAGGRILHSTDAFATWTAQSSGTTAFLMAVAAYDSSRALVAGVGGTILRTTDGGATWVKPASGTAAPLHSVAYASESTAVAVGGFGALVRSTDGGATWSSPVIPYRPVLNAVHFFDSLRGYVAGDGGICYGTADGGASWSVVPAPSRLVAIARSNSGLAAAVGGTLELTPDAGASWESHYVPETIEAAAFRDSATLFGAGPGGFLSAFLLTGADAPPLALHSPADGADSVQMIATEAAPLGLAFRWEPYAPYLASAFRLQIAFDSAASDGDFFDGIVGQGAHFDTTSVIGGITPGQPYFWRMRAEFGTRFGPWSARRSFTASPGRLGASVAQIQAVAAESLAVADALQNDIPSRWTAQASSARDSLRIVVGVCTVPTDTLRTAMGANFTDMRDWFILSDTGAGGGFWSGMKVYNSFQAPPGNDSIFWRIRRGDVVRIAGRVAEEPAGSMNSETVFECLAIRVIDSNAVLPPAHPVSIGELYWGGAPYGTVRYSTGERYEGMRVELTNLTVYAPEKVSAGTVTLIDPDGNTLSTVDDSRWFTLREHRSPGSTYAPPQVGAHIDTLRGILRTAAGRYRIMPVTSGDLVPGEPRRGALGGRVFNDLNRNGAQDDGEPPLPNWRIEIGGKIRVSLSTDSLGRFSLAGLDSGAYSISREARFGWAGTIPDSGAWNFLLALHDTSVANDFGLFMEWNTIAGSIYRDMDEDGTRDSLDPGLAGWIVRLTGEAADSALTDAEGRYHFPNVRTGVHYVNVSLEPSWEETIPFYLRGFRVDFRYFDLHEDGYDFSVHPVPARVRLAVTLRNDIGNSREVWFGVRPGASYGIWGTDPGSTTFDYSEGETEIPPQTEGIFDARLVDPRGGLDRFGEGGWTDIRDYTSAAQIDTHRVTFLPGTNFGGNYPMTLRWSRAWALRLYNGPLLLVDTLGGVTDMKLADSLVITDPAITSLLIIGEGPALTTAGASQAAEDPPHYALAQNYPNPFNPVTTIDVSIPSAGPATLAVYDILGRTVALLLSGEQEAGVRRVRWDASDVPSGVYFCRLTAGRFVETRKMLLLR